MQKSNREIPVCHLSDGQSTTFSTCSTTHNLLHLFKRAKQRHSDHNFCTYKRFDHVDKHKFNQRYQDFQPINYNFCERRFQLPSNNHLLPSIHCHYLHSYTHIRIYVQQRQNLQLNFFFSRDLSLSISAIASDNHLLLFSTGKNCPLNMIYLLMKKLFQHTQISSNNHNNNNSNIYICIFVFFPASLNSYLVIMNEWMNEW